MKHWENRFMGWLTCLLSTTYQNLTLSERLPFNTSDRKQVKEDWFKCIFEVVLQVETLGHTSKCCYVHFHRTWLKLNNNLNIKGQSWCILLWFEIVLGPIYQDMLHWALLLLLIGQLLRATQVSNVYETVMKMKHFGCLGDISFFNIPHFMSAVEMMKLQN